MREDNGFAGARAGRQTIVVRQVLGEKEKQKVVDMHVRVPDTKPAIDQIVDVFVKNVAVNSVDVITDRVIARGEFTIKAIYVACLPENPVHALEIKHCKWTQNIDIPGARKGMDSEVTANLEFVKYDVSEMTRAYKYKYKGNSCCDSPSDSCCCSDDCDDSCMMKSPHGMVKPSGHHNKQPTCAMPQPCPPEPCPPEPCPPAVPPCVEVPPTPPVVCAEICSRDFDVSVVLNIRVKVLADRKVQINCTPVNEIPLPERPKG